MNAKRHVVNSSPPQILSLMFLSFIILGTCLLKLPISTTEGITWLDAFFTATSAMTVTGLIVVDTGQAFSLTGEIIILSLIQIGGLGIMTFAVLIFILLGKKIGIKERLLVQQALNQTNIGGVVYLIKRLFYFSIVIESIAALLLFLYWLPGMGWRQGLYSAIFHSVSAFNNAGFSIYSDSLMGFVGDPIVNMIISFLFILGGIGFTVIFDLIKSKNFRDLSLHTKLMVIGTIVTNFIAMFLVFILEYSNPETLGKLSFFDKVWAAYFQGVVPRTAGFNSIDIGSMDEATLFLMMLLMFVGAGSASTGGGIKLTTFLAMVLSVLTFLKGKEDVMIFRKTITDRIVVRSLAIAIIGISVIFLGVFILDITENAPFIMILFETISAFGTVGLSMGLTGDLTWIGKLVIICVMFVGKIGPLTLAFAFAYPEKSKLRYPKEDILTG
ncbi:TrkH family potassium uptake protein [Alkalihalobacillus sp. AL-G]|uniref:TrkH family potassium uptake protein n=1 Tax=Alkalihalobacillus sp. AL-G TaxID=2926399 RepID=UPI00272C7612|nr:TrkH family potassium uptake protein [Alkalihalobacillus sp. AL-G]WLD92651.1 TrkH family potassium uptake protein [Alkalihalobacillus sp. AL-G]